MVVICDSSDSLRLWDNYSKCKHIYMLQYTEYSILFFTHPNTRGVLASVFHPIKQARLSDDANLMTMHGIDIGKLSLNK